MNATTALEKQIERYRQMTGAQRLSIALDLHELSCDIAREGIRRQHPGAVAKKLNGCSVNVSHPNGQEN